MGELYKNLTLARKEAATGLQTDQFPEVLQKFQCKAEGMTMKPGKRGTRTALHQPAVPRTPLLGYSFTQPPSDGINCSIVKGCNPSQPGVSSLYHPPPVQANTSVQLCNELNWKSSIHINFFPQVNFDTISCPIHSPHDRT